MDLSRRTLMKVLGLTAAGSALPGCEREVHRLVPYLLPDDEIVPGVANWYASVCGECAAGCGVLVRVMEGRAKKIEGHPEFPINQGKVCARGQAGVQTLYHPDRLRRPLKREGARGEGRFVPIPWEEAMALWVEQLRAHPGGAAMLSTPLTGSLHGLLSIFFRHQQGTLRYYDPSGEPAVRASMQASFGMDHLPHFDLAHSDYVLSFGAPFLEHWLSPVMFSIAYGHMRQGRPGLRGRFVQIEPRLSLTAANADRWVPVRPGTEGLLALGLGHLLLEGADAALSEHERRTYRGLYGRYRLEDVAQKTDVPAEMITRLAAEFAQASAPLAIAGGLAAAHSNGTASLMAVNSLNVLAGRLGRTGGLRWRRPVSPPGGPPATPGGEQTVLDLVTEFDEGRGSVLHLYQSNPLFTCPPTMGVARLFERAAFIVSFGSFLDESAIMADLILPDHAWLESWGDHVVHGVSARPAVGLRQPVVAPLYNTRSIGDVFLEAAHHLGGPVADHLPEASLHDRLSANWAGFLSGVAAEANVRFPQAWVSRLQQGGWWGEDETALPARRLTMPPVYEPPQIAGSEDEFPFWFLPFFSPTLQRDGAHLPWLQELPDPLSTAVWGSWVELHPDTARRLRIQDGQVVRIRSPFGAIEAPAILMPGLRPDAVAMPIGQGHTAYGRYAKDRGANPLAILAPVLDPRSGTLALCGTRVRLEPTERKGRPILMDQRGGGGALGQGLIGISRGT